jgi:hypothetical protein
MAGVPEPPPEAAVRDAIDALAHAEQLIVTIGREGFAKKLNELHDFVEELSNLQLDLRMARIRLQAHLPDEDKTPLPPGISTATLRRVQIDRK